MPQPSSESEGKRIGRLLRVAGLSLSAAGSLVAWWSEFTPAHHTLEQRVWLTTVGLLCFTGGLFLSIMGPAAAMDRSLRRAFPHQPWRWREDWEARKVSRSLDGQNLFAVVVVLGFVAVALFCVQFFWSTAWLGSAIGGGLAVMLVGYLLDHFVRTRRRPSHVLITEGPGWIGDGFTVQCEFLNLVVRPEPYEVTLVCEREEGSGDDYSLTELHRLPMEVTTGVRNPTPPGTDSAGRLTANLLLPPAVAPTQTELRIRWVIEVRERGSRRNPCARFEVPVFRRVRPTQPIVA